MVSTCSGLSDSSGKIYYIPDQGCFAEKGKDYEKTVTAFISLEASNNFDDFCLISNPINCAPFDDIILCTKKNYANIIYLFQIKSKTDPISIFDDEFKNKIFNKNKSKFFIGMLHEKYKKGIIEIKRIIPQKYVAGCKFEIIFFTNRPIQENSDIFELTHKNLFNAKHGEIYKFKREFILKQDKQNFLQSISVYAKQTNVDDTSVSWIKQYLNSEDDAAKKIKLQFFLCIRNYCEIQTEKESLSKEFVCKLFAYATFVSFAVCIDDFNENDYKKYQQVVPMDSLWESIKNNNISMSCNHVQYILGKAISQFQDLNISPDDYDYYKQIIFDESNMTKKQLEFYIGCLLGELPFIVRSQNFTLPKKYCKVIFIESNSAEGQGNLSKINALDLKVQTITTNCGQKFKIGTLIKEIGENISVSDVISMIISCANNSNNKLEFFIKQKLNKVTLNSKIVLHKNSLNSTPDIFIINSNGFSKEDFIKQFNVDKKLVLEVKSVKEITAYLQNFEKDPFFKTKKFYKFILINKHRTYISYVLANVHFLHYFKDAPLVWTKSNGSTKNIMNYLTDTICNDITNEGFGENKCKCCVYLEDVNSYFQNNFLIISGVPGIGKTTYLKQFASFVPTKDFILFVTLMEFYDYFESIEAKSSDAEKHISHFYKDKDKVLKQVFEAKLKTKQIIILFDGFDEIAPRYTDIVSKIIKEIRKAEYKIILTTRSVLKNKVENIFSTFATSLSPFSPIDQIDFLKICFDKISSNVFMDVYELIDVIRKNVDSEFLSVPLNIFLIAEVLYTEINNKNFKLTNFKINLFQLYEKFINYKLKIYSEKITNKNINLLSINRYHQYFAIDKLFKKLDNFHIIKASLKDAISNYSIELKTGGEKIGFLISDINEIFIHRTVAEFFAAQWLSEVFDPPEDYQHIKHEKRFATYVIKLIYSLKVDFKFKILNDMDFTVIKSFFESIINNRNKLHQAAAESNYEYIKTIFHSDSDNVISSVNEIKCLNVLKRPLLNTIISKNDLLYKKETLQVNISLVKVLILLIKPKDILTQKDILEASIKDYVNIKQKQIKKSPLKIIVHKSVNNRYSVYFSRLFELWEIFHEQNLYNCNLQDVFQGLEKQNKVYTIFNAVSNGHLNILQQFYKSGLNMNIQNQDNKSLIHFAAKNRHLDIVKFLYDINKSIIINKLDLKDDKEQTVLHYAVISGNLDMVKYLKEKKVNLMSYDNEGLTAFHYAVILTKITIAEYFLTLNFNFYSRSKFGYSPIEYAVGFLNKKMFKFLLSKGADINYTNEYGNSIVHILIYINIYVNRLLPLETSKKYNKRCFDFTTFLVKSYVSLNQKDPFGRTPLMIAVLLNSLCVKILIENHADLNCLDNNGSTILHMAALGCNIDILGLILPYFDINVKDDHKNSTLHYALSYSDNIDCFKVVNFLIKSGANPQSTNNDGTTPLHCAAFSGHLEVLKLLLTHSNINVQDSKGYTPLHYALINKEVHTARFLINNGASVNLGSKNNELPLDIALSSSLTEIKEIVSMLKAMNAKSDGKKLTFIEPFDRSSLYPHLKKNAIFTSPSIFFLIKKYINIIIQESDT